VIELSRYTLEALRKDEEFILYRGRSQGDASGVLVLSPVRNLFCSIPGQKASNGWSTNTLLERSWIRRGLPRAALILMRIPRVPLRSIRLGGLSSRSPLARNTPKPRLEKPF